jgi:transposase InsO family protein
MNIHKNARLTLKRRIDLVREIVDRKMPVSAAAVEACVSVKTAAKWLARYLAEGEQGLKDRSSRPARSPRSISPGKAMAIVELRRRCLTQARIASALGVSKSTVSRVLARAGLSRLSDLAPKEPVVRYEHERPGDLLHLDTKKLGRIHRPGKRIPGSPYRSVGAGWETLFVAVDDHSRVAFTDLYPDECQANAVQFLENSVRYYQSLGVRIRRVLTDNGSAFRSKSFALACGKLRITHKFTRAYRPQTNGKAERFIQSALREWAYAAAYNHSTDRATELERWIHHYNWHRPHQGIHGVAPASRLASSKNNLLTLHS